MSHDTEQDTAATPEVQEIEETIQRHREDLAQTVDALSARLDVKARARDAMSSATAKVRSTLTGPGEGPDSNTDPARLVALALSGVAVVTLWSGVARRTRR
ncbi:DUF3618 domain-containing protein [Serinicoccus sp. LYQ131]|uniref:DUF3618 domain-containing protein n=1 Tax=Serinicoccus sp. LYQ131 TaxID=3378797 RepID=UPI003854A9A2